MASKLTIGAVLALLLGAGVWNALRPGVSDSAPPAVANERMMAISRQIGPWVATDSEVNLKTMRIAEVEAYLSRRYVNQLTKESYSVMLLYGPPGDLGAHDPKTCYAGTGFEQCGIGTKQNVSRGSDELWKARFERTSPSRETLEVFWGWGTHGDWKASDRPRLDFANESRIYKIYIQRSLSSNKLVPVGDRSSEFLEPLLAEVKLSLSNVSN
jgi:Protein of unknown function (DUF3485)